jgi:hypothetical protein
MNEELVQQVAKAIKGADTRRWNFSWQDMARAAIEAVYAYQATHGTLSDAMNADWWVEPPRDGEA